jgi:lysophospholipase L1-like esterase
VGGTLSCDWNKVKEKWENIAKMWMSRKLSSCVFLIFCACAIAMLLVGCDHENMGQQTSTKDPIVYVALGDSTGAGVGAREGGYVARIFNRLVERRPGSKLSNLCVSGATTVDLVRSQLDRGVALNPDLVTVGIGINDIGHGLTLEQFSKNYEEIISTLKEKTHAQIVVTNIPDISTAPRIPGPMRSEYQRQIEQFSERLGEIAGRHGVTVFDVHTITKAELPSHPEYFSADGFHPSDAGYELWASSMWPTVEEVINRR